jgi:hypothetical protein
MYEAAASCKDISRAPVTNWERLQDTVRRETRDVTMFFYGLAARTEQNNERTLVRYDVLLQAWTGLNRNELCDLPCGGGGGGQRGRCVGLTTLPPSCADCLESLAALASWTPKGLFRSVMWCLLWHDYNGHLTWRSTCFPARTSLSI